MFWKIFAVAALLVAAVHVGATHQNNVSEPKIISLGANWVESSEGEYRVCSQTIKSGFGRTVHCAPWGPAFKR